MTRTRDQARATAPEREVADLLAIEADPEDARHALRRVPLWFHTFALNRAESIYTPGVARDHRYRVSALPEDFSGLSVLDVGTFDGFYAFLAEARGAERVVAVDNEQYRDWVRARWGVELAGGEGFRVVRELLGSGVEYRRFDAFDLDGIGERFDVIYCFGILHRVENPLGLLRVLRGCLNENGRVLLETYGARRDGRPGATVIQVLEPGTVYPNDDYVYWGFPAAGLTRLATVAGFEHTELIDTPTIDSHPRILGALRAGGRTSRPASARETVGR